METLLRIGLSNAVAAVLLALVVATAACVWRRPALLHALWLLVLVKLVTPPLLWLPEPWATPALQPAIVEKSPEPTPVDSPPDAPRQDGEAAAADAAAPPPALDVTFVPVPDPEPETPAPTAEAPPTAPISTPAQVAAWWVFAAAGAWLAGSATWYALAVCRLRRFRRLLRHAKAAPESLRQRTQRLAEKMRLRRCPTVWLVPGRLAPMLWAAGGRPRILFPSELMEFVGVEGQNALLVHELAHLRRRDHWVRWLEFAAAGLYWWHPVLWFARRELREAEELCCDAWVTATLPGAGKSYAAALLETLDFLSDSPPAAPLLASGVGRVADLKRRLTMIMRGTTPKTLGWRGCLAVLGTGLLMLPLLPAWARAQVAATPPAVAPPPAPTPAAAAPAGGDQDNARAALQAAEAELEQKQAEVALLTAKVQLLRARVKAEQAVSPAKSDGVAARFVDKDGITVEITGDAALQDMLKKLQAKQPGMPGGGVIVLDKVSGKIIMKVEGAGAPPPPEKPQHWIMVPMGPMGGTVGPMGGSAGTPPAADTDKRIDDLETKLKSILDEVDKLRRERKTKTPEGGAALPGSAGAPVLKAIPYLERLFDNASASAQTQVRALEVQAQADEAQHDKLLAELADLQAKAQATDQEAGAAAAQAKAALAQAEAALKLAQAKADQAQSKSDAGAVPEADLKTIRAEAEVRRADLAQAEARLEQQVLTSKSLRADLEKQAAGREAAMKACEENLKHIQKEMSKLKSAPAGVESPAKP